MENIVGKGENAGHQHFLIFPLCFQKAFFLGVVKEEHAALEIQASNPLITNAIDKSEEEYSLHQIIKFQSYLNPFLIHTHFNT